MKLLVRVLRRQVGRLRDVQGWQVALLTLLIGTSAAVVTATALGQPDVAVTLGALTAALVFVAVLAVFGRVSLMHRAALATAQETRDVVDQMQRRVVAAVEKERLAAGDRYHALEEAFQRSEEVLVARFDRTRRAQMHQLDALLQLVSTIPLRAPLSGWSATEAADPVDVLRLVAEILRRRPRLVLDLGGGPSAVWLAYALEKTGGRLLTLHHDAATARQTRDVLATHCLADVAEVREAPLRPTTVDGRTVPWYDTAALADLADIDMLVLGGPPESVDPDARSLALAIVANRLAVDAAVLSWDGDSQPLPEVTPYRAECVSPPWTDTTGSEPRIPPMYAQRDSSLAAVPE